MLEITAAAHDAMVAHAIRELPNEAAGLFAGVAGSNLIEKFSPMTNKAESTQIYQLDGAEMMAVEKANDDAGLLVMGVMHSHTHTPNYPSPTDVADAAHFDPFGSWLFIIVSLRDPDPSMRGYRIMDGEIAEEPLSVLPANS